VRFQFLGINLPGARTKEAAFTHGDGVLKIAANPFQLLHLGAQRLLLRLEQRRLRAQSLRLGEQLQVLRLPQFVLQPQRFNLLPGAENCVPAAMDLPQPAARDSISA
jgi:hypothetical protein